jgi:uncharacterized protein (TIGR02271 family)
MGLPVSVNVTGAGEFRGTIEAVNGAACVPESAAGPLRVRLEDGRELLTPPDALRRQPDGSYRLQLHGPDLAQLTDQLASAGGGSASGGGDVAGVVVPVLGEELKVGKRTVETGRVRVSKHVREEEQVVETPLIRESVDVERVAVNQMVEGPQAVRQEGDTTVIPVVEEVLVVEKRLMLKEEVRVTKRRAEVQEPVRAAVRREEVKIEHIRGDGAGGGTDVA